MPLYLSPVCNGQTFDANGDPLTGGQIEIYLAGSSTPAATFTDDTGSTPQSNPIILNSLGYPTLGSIWLTGGLSYKFIIKNSFGVTLRTIDDIPGINDASVSQSEWVESGFTPTYISATSFSVPGDQTMILQINRRVRTTNTSGLVYSTISNSVFAAGITTVTLTNDSTTLDAGLSLVAYALLAADPLSVPNLPGSKISGLITSTGLTMSTARVLGRTTASTGPIQELDGTTVQTLQPINQVRVDVASASTVNLTTSAPNTDHINITGTVTINGFTIAAGRTIFVRFSGPLVLTSGAAITTQTGANITTQNGDTCIIRAPSANTVEILSYREGRWGPNAGSAPLYPCRAWVNFDGTSGSIRASGNVSSVTRNSTGNYTVNFSTAMADANYAVVPGGRITAPAYNSIQEDAATARTTSSVRISSSAQNAGNPTAVDVDVISISVFR